MQHTIVKLALLTALLLALSRVHTARACATDDATPQSLGTPTPSGTTGRNIRDNIGEHRNPIQFTKKETDISLPEPLDPEDVEFDGGPTQKACMINPRI